MLDCRHLFAVMYTFEVVDRHLQSLGGCKSRPYASPDSSKPHYRSPVLLGHRPYRRRESPGATATRAWTGTATSLADECLPRHSPGPAVRQFSAPGPSPPPLYRCRRSSGDDLLTSTHLLRYGWLSKANSLYYLVFLK